MPKNTRTFTHPLLSAPPRYPVHLAYAKRRSLKHLDGRRAHSGTRCPGCMSMMTVRDSARGVCPRDTETSYRVGQKG